MSLKLVFWPPQQERSHEWPARIEEAVEGAHVVAPDTQDAAIEELRDADAIYAHEALTPAALEAASQVRWIHSSRAGPPAGWYHPALIEHPAVVTNPAGIYSDHIAMHVLSFVLAFARGLHYYIPQQLRHEYQQRPTNTGVVYLPEATALIIGVGGIGAETARLCAQLGMRVAGVDARREQPPEGVAELHRPDVLDRLLPEADFVIMTVPETPETQRMMDSARLRQMKPGGFLINVGRGATVVLADLVEALHAGAIAGAGLDVLEVEPLPPDHPLWSAPNLLLTPHTAAYGPFIDDRRLEVLIDNCRRFAAGEPLRNVVDKTNWF